MIPQGLDDAIRLADMLAKSKLIPKDFQGKPADALVAIQWGAEVGLAPLQAMQNIAVINGRPCIWGDAMLALSQHHPQYEYHREYIEDDVAYCIVKRTGSPEHTASFSVEDAKTANLWGRNTWKSYPKRMLQMRARGFALRDQFADALKGLSMREEVEDYHPKLTSPDVIEGEASCVDNLADMIDELVYAESQEELESYLPAIKSLSSEDQDQIRGIYSNKLKELKGEVA
tara:strand:- start:487 stop:1176 length:690 start_codon:yes stop_codon:yes gene_type:complete